MKAWQLYSDASYDGHCLIVFAETRSKARAKARGTDEFDGIDYVNIDAYRSPKFDGREKNPPGLKELVEEHGWFTECAGCQEKLMAGETEIVWTNDTPRCARCDAKR